MCFYVVDGDHGEVLADASEGAGENVDQIGGVVLALLPVENLHSGLGVVICLYVGGGIKIKEIGVIIMVWLGGKIGNKIWGF